MHRLWITLWIWGLLWETPSTPRRHHGLEHRRPTGCDPRSARRSHVTTDEPVDYERTWHAALEDMDKHGIGSRDRAYLNLTRFVGLLGDNVLLSVPFDQTKRMLEGPLREPVAKALSDQLGQQVRVAISVDESLQAAVRDLDDDGDASDENTSAATESGDGTLGFTVPGQLSLIHI